METNIILNGSALDMLKKLPDESVNCVVTSPPYWGLRDYNNDSQIGLEATPEQFIKNLVAIFSEVKRVLKKDGTLWVNIGDTYGGPSGGGQGKNGQMVGRSVVKARLTDKVRRGATKQLTGIPWRLAFALQDDGWLLRQDIIWSKPNPMPESVRDRCTKSHEYIFMLTKSLKYYFNQEAIKEPATYGGDASRYARADARHKSNPTEMNNGIRPRLKNADKSRVSYDGKRTSANGAGDSHGDGQKSFMSTPEKRNKRSVWEVATKPYKEAHFATYPTALITPAILAGCPEGGIVLDPFFGSGTTGLVAKNAGMQYIGIELNAEYVKIAEKRLAQIPLL